MRVLIAVLTALQFSSAMAQETGFDPQTGIPPGGLHPSFPANYTCPPITSYYDSWLDVDETYREDIHEGIDLGNWGDAILAPADGEILAVWPTDVSYGPEWALLIVHSAADMNTQGDDIYFSEFYHLQGEDVTDLEIGQRLLRGQKIAVVRTPGGSRALLPETHWETNRVTTNTLHRMIWTDNGLDLGALTWYLDSSELIDPLALMALHQRDRKVAKITPFDATRDYSDFVGFTYPLACVRN